MTDLPSHHHHKAFKCPWCKHEMDMSHQLAGEHNRPQGGDGTLCIECGRISVFLGTSELRRPTYEEYIAIALLPEMLLAKAAWEATIGKERRKRGRM